MAKLDEQQLKLDGAKAEAAKELADAVFIEAMEDGQTEFVKAVVELDHTAREVVISTVLESFENDSRRAQIQAWVAAIPERKPIPGPTQPHDKTEVSPGADPAPTPNQPDIPSAKPESSVSDPTPTE